MKEKYTKPDLEVLHLTCEDVVMTSDENETPFEPFSI